MSLLFWDDVDDEFLRPVPKLAKSLKLFSDQHYADIGPGWKSLLVGIERKFTVKIAKRRIDDGVQEADIQVQQVKEKFAGLRIYVDHQGFSEDAVADIFSILNFVETLSYRICEECGSPDVTTRTQVREDGKPGGWLKTYCAVHHQMRDSGQDPWKIRLEAKKAALKTVKEV